MAFQKKAVSLKELLDLRGDYYVDSYGCGAVSSVKFKGKCPVCHYKDKHPPLPLNLKWIYDRAKRIADSRGIDKKEAMKELTDVFDFVK